MNPMETETYGFYCVQQCDSDVLFMTSSVKHDTSCVPEAREHGVYTPTSDSH